MDTLRLYESHRGNELVGEMWRLQKSTWIAVTTLTTHELGWELRTHVKNALMHSEVLATETSVLEASRAWRAAWEKKGWTAYGAGRW